MEKLLLLMVCILILGSCGNEDQVCCTCTDKTLDGKTGAVINQQSYDTCFLSKELRDDYEDENTYTSQYIYVTTCETH